MITMAMTPGCNVMYSGHGGPAWLILPFAFPATLLILFRAFRASPHDERSQTKRFIVMSLAVYVVVAFAGAHLGAASIKRSFGLEVPPLQLWGLLLSPLGWVVFI
jgi:hypothetical protein